MPSQALEDYRDRLAEVQQLLDAHTALAGYRRAQAVANEGAAALADIGAIVQALVTPPKRGRPTEVHALNSAGIALLSAHLQGFIVDLYKEVAQLTLAGKVRDVASLIDAANLRANPTERNIIKLFASIGYPAILDGISWKRMSNKLLRKNIESLNTLRNKIVHGASGRVRKVKVIDYLSVFRNFGKHLDAKMRAQVHAVTGEYPWPAD